MYKTGILSGYGFVKEGEHFARLNKLENYECCTFIGGFYPEIIT